MFPGTEEYGVDIWVDTTEAEKLCQVTPADVTAADSLSFARNVFIPLTTACRYTCTYCTYFDPPGQASLLTPEEIRNICERGAAAGCTEALFTFGDDPDERYSDIFAQLDDLGHHSIHSYLREACEIALECGLLPHSNPGDQTREQMELVAPLNASMGVMLETTAKVDAHAGPRKKTPGQRLATIETAGKLGIPFTTGILVGIGESWMDRAESILAIKELHDRYGHIQEIIVQPVRDNERWNQGTPPLEDIRRVTAMARAGLPEDISIQVPPNLTPVQELLDCGVDDFGGVSPVTDDYVNPDYSWPALQELQRIAVDVGVPLSERLPVHERYYPEWLSPTILDAIAADSDAGNRLRAVLEGKRTFQPN